MDVCVYMYTHIYIYIYTHIYMDIHIRRYIYICIVITLHIYCRSHFVIGIFEFTFWSSLSVFSAQVTCPLFAWKEIWPVLSVLAHHLINWREATRTIQPYFFLENSINNQSTINNLNLDSPFSGRSGDSDGTALSPSSNLPIAAFAAGVTVACHVWLKVLAGSFVVIPISSGVVSGILHQM